MPKNSKKPQPQPLTEQQQQAALLIAAGGMNATVGEAVGVSEWTVSRWRQQPEFQAGVNTILRDAKAAARERLRSLVGAALDVVETSLTDAQLAPRERLQAAFHVLTLINLAAGDPIGPTVPEEIERRRRKAWERATNRFLSSADPTPEVDP